MRLTRKGLPETIGAAIAWPKGVTTGLAWPNAANPPPENVYEFNLINYSKKHGEHLYSCSADRLMLYRHESVTNIYIHSIQQFNSIF